MQNILLTIAIPTFNRAEWLKLCLSQLTPQLNDIHGEVEVSIYDNASPDHTETIARSFLGEGLPISYFRNTENIGSDRNIAQCFNKARGKYVLILGDDDVLVRGALSHILKAISIHDSCYGAIYIKAYGYDDDFIKERPFQILEKAVVYDGYDKFLRMCGSNMAFISSLIINKSNISKLDANQFVGSALVQTYLFFEAAKSSEKNLYIDKYLVAAKRIEQRDYDVTEIFSSSFNKALSYFESRGLSAETIKSINTKLLWYFFPIFLMHLRKNPALSHNTQKAYIKLKSRYKKNLIFWLCTYPILKFPARIGILWGGVVIVFSRVINGEFGRLYTAITKKFRLHF